MEVMPMDPTYLLSLAEFEQKITLFVLTFIFFEHILRACFYLPLDKNLWTDSHSFLYDL